MGRLGCIKRLFMVCAFFVSISAMLVAGETWITINTRAGLPSNNLTCLAITKGMMAVGSDSGIGLFIEGFDRWFNLSDYNELLKGLTIRSIDFDGYGNIWAATPSGVFCVELAKFPEESPLFRRFDTENGLSTVDTEVLQIVGDKLYVGCFGGWLYQTNIFQSSAGITFLPVNSQGMGRDDEHRIMSVGVTAIAMDFPNVGIYSTKGKGLLRADNGQSLVVNSELPSDWVNDFWSFSRDENHCVIAVTQDKMPLIENYNLVGQAQLPEKECWISCLTTAPDEETEAINTHLKDEDIVLDKLLGDRVLYVGTKGKGLWKFDEGRWTNFTSRDCPLPSDNINKVYYLPGAKKMAILTDGGLTMFGLTEEYSYDEFEFRGSTPFFAKTFWPFLTSWGPMIMGVPDHHYYPIEPFITYKKLVRGKDLWVSHEKGLSRFAFPSAPFLGAMQFQYKLAGRYENPKDDPSKNASIEDGSFASEKPAALEGERLWHHYCQEQPADLVTAPISTIFSSLDMKTLVGPLNQVNVSVSSPGDFDPEETADIVQQASSTLGVPPVIVLETEDGLFDIRGKKLYSIADQLIECPRHAIPSTDITDFDIDLKERCWVIFESSFISILDSVDYSGGLTFGLTHGHEWVDVSPEQVPWAKEEELICIRKIGGNIYVGTSGSGMYLLPAAHSLEPYQITWDMWTNVDETEDSNRAQVTKTVKEIAFWKTDEGPVAALMHEKGLSIFDGRDLVNIPVPEKLYTCMVADRLNQLWLGSIDGLVYLSPDLNIHEVHMDPLYFESDKIIAMAAAPDDAKYPFTLAVAYDKLWDPDLDFWKTSDVPPGIFPDHRNPYRMHVVNPETGGSKVLLWNGQKWEILSRPGVHHLMFDQKHLWTATSNRIMRLYLPVEQTTY